MTASNNIKELFENCGFSQEQQADILLEYVSNQQDDETLINFILENHKPVDLTGKIKVEIQRRVHMIADEFVTYAIPEAEYRQRLSISGFKEITAFNDVRDSSYNGECVRLAYRIEPNDNTETHSEELQEL